MDKNDMTMGAMAIISIFVIVVCVYVINQMGTNTDTIKYTRTIFGIGIATGFFMSGCGRILGFYLTNVIKKLKSKRCDWI